MEISEVNIQLFRAINNMGKEYPFLNEPFIILAEYAIFLLMAALLIYWFTRKQTNRLMVISAVFSSFLAEIVGKSLGLLYSHHQPFAVLTSVNQLIDKNVGNSFPSDHTMVFFSVCVSIALIRRKYWPVWVLLALAVGISRIWVGVHYPVDIIVGALLGSGSALLVYKGIPSIPFVRQSIYFYEKGENYLFGRSRNL